MVKHLEGRNSYKFKYQSKFYIE